MESGRGAGTVVAAPNSVFVAKSISVSVSVSVFVYRVGCGGSNSLLISLDVNVLNIGVFSGPSSPSFPPTVLSKAVSVISVVAIPTTMRPPPEDQD